MKSLWDTVSFALQGRAGESGMGWGVAVNDFKSVILSVDVLTLWHAQHHGKSCESTEHWT